LFQIDGTTKGTIVPGNKMKDLGFEPVGTRVLINEKEEYEFTGAIIKILGDTTAGSILLGNDNCEPILGINTLESIGIIVEPVTKELKRLPAIPLK
jgi:hypothetical protein